jgi:hypothetical protein
MDPASGSTAGRDEGQLVGRFTYHVGSEKWWWSPEIYAMHGFEHGDVVPTSELMQSHHHHEDRVATVSRLRDALMSGEAFSARHRIIDANSVVRTVLAVGEGVRDGAGRVVQLVGYFIDETSFVSRLVARETQAAVAASARSRAVIEQAKGMLMLTYGLDDTLAFSLLTRHSQHHNIRLRDLAAQLVQHVREAAVHDAPPATTLNAFFDGLAGRAFRPGPRG